MWYDAARAFLAVHLGLRGRENERLNPGTMSSTVNCFLLVDKKSIELVVGAEIDMERRSREGI